MRTTTNPRGHTHARAAIAIAAATLLTIAGCSEEQRRDLGEADVRDALASQVERVLVDEDLALEGDLDCTSDIGADAQVSASCSGTAESGEAIVGSFAGTADVDAEECTAQLAVEIDGAQVVDEPDVDCFEAL